MLRIMRLALALVLVFPLLACQRPAAQSPSGSPVVASSPWQSTEGKDHVLVGRVYDVRRAAFVTPAQLHEHLSPARFVLLGEKHDNLDHHRLQAEVVKSLGARGQVRSVAFEMWDDAQQPKLDAFVRGRAASEIPAQVGWEERGWGPFAQYQPIAEAALAHGFPLIGANVPGLRARLLQEKGVSGVAPRVAPSLAQTEFSAAEERELAEELRASHCGHLPEDLVAPMALAQHVRDARMALALSERAQANGAVLIAGAGHTRKDRAVPRFLPPGTALTVAFVEVTPGLLVPEAYEQTRLHDFVYFTPGVASDDPCAKFGAPKEKKP